VAIQENTVRFAQFSLDHFDDSLDAVFNHELAVFDILRLSRG
jgi:hypothetical protein